MGRADHKRRGRRTEGGRGGQEGGRLKYRVRAACGVNESRGATPCTCLVPVLRWVRVCCEGSAVTGRWDTTGGAEGVCSCLNRRANPGRGGGGWRKENKPCRRPFPAALPRTHGRRERGTGRTASHRRCRDRGAFYFSFFSRRVANHFSCRTYLFTAAHICMYACVAALIHNNQGTQMLFWDTRTCVPGVSRGGKRSLPAPTGWRCSAGSAPGTAGAAGASGSRSPRTPGTKNTWHRDSARSARTQPGVL